MLGKYSLALEVFQSIEKDLDDSFIMKSYKFTEERVKRQINPITPEKINISFGKSLAKKRISVLKFKQWLLWSKQKCLSELKAPYLSAVICENYLSFVQKYQITMKIPEIYRISMMLQTCRFITDELTKEIEKIINVNEIQQRFFYSALSRLYFQEKQYLHKLVHLVYSMKPLSMLEQYEKSLKMLNSFVSNNQNLSDFRNFVKKSHNRENFKIIEFPEIIAQIDISEMRNIIGDIKVLLDFDKTLKDFIRDYSARGRAQRNTDYVNFFDLQWLLFYEPENGPSVNMRGYEIATSNFEKSPWGLLYEYAQMEKLLMHIIREKSEKDAILAAIDLCSHYLNKKNDELANLLWNAILLISSQIKDFNIDVTKIFEISTTKSENEPKLLINNPFKEFQLDKIYLTTNNTTYLISKNLPENSHTILKTFANEFSVIQYGTFSNTQIMLLRASCTFFINVQDEKLIPLSRFLNIELFRPQTIRMKTNLLIFKIESNFTMQKSFLQIGFNIPYKNIQENALILENSQKISEIPIYLIKNENDQINCKINLPKFGKNAIFIGLFIENERTQIELEKLIINSSIYNCENENIEISRKSFDLELPKQLEIFINTIPYNDKKAIQTIIMSNIPIKINSLYLEIEGIDNEKGIFSNKSLFLYRNNKNWN